MLQVFERLCLSAKLHYIITKNDIESGLKKIAEKFLPLNLLQNFKDHIKLYANLNIPTVKELEQKSIDYIKTEMHTCINTEIQHISNKFNNNQINSWFNEEKQKLENSLQNDQWKNIFRGKEIFNKFCADIFKTDKLQVRQAYVEIALKEKPEIFQDIIDFFTTAVSVAPSGETETAA